MHQHHDHDDIVFPNDPLDPQDDLANSALADAMRASFRILKVILIGVVVLYLFSGTLILDQNEKAVVSYFGRMQDQPLGPGGIHFTLPRPFAEHVRVSVEEKKTLVIDGHFLGLKGDETLAGARRAGGLDPTLDGALMTGDRGLVHARWTVTYEVTDLPKFYSNVRPTVVRGRAPAHGATQVSESDILTAAVESAAVRVVGQMTAADVTRHDIEDMQNRIQQAAQETLDRMGAGITLATLTSETIAPLQTKQAFELVTQMANLKRVKRDEALKARTEMLNLTAGAAYVELEAQFDAYMLARQSNDSARSAGAMGDIETVIRTQATGLAGQIIRGAESLRKSAVEDIRADAEEFRSYLVEYQRNRRLLFERLWNAAQEEIFASSGVTKRLLPPGQKVVRVKLSPDPEEQRAAETESYLQKERQQGDFSRDEVRRTDNQPRGVQKVN